eukprot:COSAG01_NODE_1006_length_12163_cov_237.845669_14_plen_73_part_00
MHICTPCRSYRTPHSRILPDLGTWTLKVTLSVVIFLILVGTPIYWFRCRVKKGDDENDAPARIENPATNYVG